ncbi:hypothetical protein J6590_075477 [Homalodisca vitripennis]|nr:hypothetical protein J6590_075477 [Homalodisca vitripennis]
MFSMEGPGQTDDVTECNGITIQSSTLRGHSAIRQINMKNMFVRELGPQVLWCKGAELLTTKELLKEHVGSGSV